MYKELLEKLSKVQLIEAGKIVIPNAAALAHDPKRKIGVWWYELKSGKFLFNAKVSHHDFTVFKEIMTFNVGTAIWIKGRAFKYNKQNCIFIYTLDFDERGIRLTGQILADIVQKTQDTTSLSISVVVDEPGHLLYQE